MAGLKRCLPLVCLVCLVSAPGLQAVDLPGAGPFGAQAALVVSASPDLRLTAGSPGLSLGLHGTWAFAPGHELRPRVDVVAFPGRNQTTSGPVTPQSLDTRVRSLALGADYLRRLDDRWAVGVGIQELRWSVASTNRVTPTPGAAPVSVSGTAHWWRLGLGPVLTCRLSRHLEAEVRATFSRYGQENQPANAASCGLLWRF